MCETQKGVRHSSYGSTDGNRQEVGHAARGTGRGPERDRRLATQLAQQTHAALLRGRQFADRAQVVATQSA